MSELIVNKDVINFFSEGSAVAICLFILFVTYVLMIFFAAKDRKESMKLTSKLSDAITGLKTEIADTKAADVERDKKYVEEFRSVQSGLAGLASDISDLRVQISSMHSWCTSANKGR